MRMRPYITLGVQELGPTGSPVPNTPSDIVKKGSTMDLTRWLRNSGSVRDCETAFVGCVGVGFFCLFIVCAVFLFHEQAPTWVPLLALAYCVPGAILAFFGASLYFARWLFLSATNAAPGTGAP